MKANITYWLYNRRFLITAILAVVLSLLSHSLCANGDEKPLTSGRIAEYKLKSAFLFNFFKFTQWPKEIEKKKELIIGVFDPEVYQIASQTLANKEINKKKLKIYNLDDRLFKKELDKDAQEMLKNLLNCQIIFVPERAHADFKVLKRLVGTRPILTIGESPKFLESGGILNFVIQDKKVRFEINLIESNKVNLKFRSQFLRLAIRIIEPKAKE